MYRAAPPPPSSACCGPSTLRRRAERLELGPREEERKRRNEKETKKSKSRRWLSKGGGLLEGLLDASIAGDGRRLPPWWVPQFLSVSVLYLSVSFSFFLSLLNHSPVPIVV